MIDFKVIRLRTGENLLCIIKEETETNITVLFPLEVTKQTFHVAKNILREVHSTSSLCPFSDDKEFTFFKHDIMFVKEMSEQAVPYYVEMLNKQEEPDLLRIYDLEELVSPEGGLDLQQVIEDKVDNLLEKMSQIEEETDPEQQVNVSKGNKILH
jgi:hypothetical protein